MLLLYRHTDDGVLNDFPNISEDSPKLVRRSHERRRTFSEIFRRLPKIAEDFLVRPEDVSMRYTDEFKNNLRDKLGISEIIDIFTSEDMENTPLESWMWSPMNFTSGAFSSKPLVSI